MKKTFIAFILAVLTLFSLTACGGNSQTDSPPPPSETNQEKETDNAPAATDNDTPEPQVTPEDLPDERGIIGSHGTDIRMGLTKFGLDEAAISKAPEEAREVFAFSSSTNYQDTDLNVTYEYSLTMDSDFQIIGASFGITNDGASREDFITIASLYLGFSATMPYNAASSSEAKAWVEEKIGALPCEDELTTTIGDAKFELFSSDIIDNEIGSIWMDIRKTAVEEEAS